MNETSRSTAARARWSARPFRIASLFRLLGGQPRILRRFQPTFGPVALLGLALCASMGIPDARADFEVTDEPPLPSRARPRFQVDAGSLLTDRGPEVAVAFRIPHSELRFMGQPGEEMANFDLIILVSKDERRIGGDLWPIRVPRTQDPHADPRAIYYRRVVRMPAETGKLLIEVSVRETETGRASAIEWEMEMPDYEKEDLSISTLWVHPCGDGGTWDMEFPPGDWILSHRYGEPLDDICVTGQIYRGEKSDPEDRAAPIDLTWRIRDVRNEILVEGSQSLPPGNEVPISIQPDLRKLWLGNYLFEVETKSGRRKAQRRFRFQMDESMVSLDTNMEQSIELVRLIADDDEIDELRQAPPEGRARAWEAFWRRRDPTPGTTDNEFRSEFFSRVRYANQNYGVLEPGWKSDRGRVHIRYGPPDEIEQRPNSMNGLAVEVWTYTRAGRRFVFVDYDGFGRYELYQPGRS